MKFLLSILSRVLVTVLFTFGGWQKSAGQATLMLKGVSVQMHSPAQVSASVINEAPTFAHRQYWILQHSEPLTKLQLADLQSAGILLGTALSPQCQVASIPASFPLAQLTELGFKRVAPYQRNMRFNPEHTADFQRSVAVMALPFQVLPQVGIKAEHLTHNWNPACGQLQSVWPGRLSKFLVMCTMAQLDSLSHCGWVQWIEPADGQLEPLNGKASASGRVNCIKTSAFAGLNGLDGKGVTVVVGDGGLVEDHGDLLAHQENLTTNKIALFGNHQDHVTGTVGGSGLLSAERQGMAPAARLLNVQTSGTVSMGASLRENENAVLTNNSYGISFACSRAGIYSATSAYIDDQLHNYRDLLHVFAAGNQGYMDCNVYPTGFRTIAEGYPVSKNVLTVGAVMAQDQFTWFSSSGPARDGRVKPEIVADGNDLESTVPHDFYEKKSGTSQAAPVITGTLALMVQRYRQLHNQQNPDNALLKGFLCNTAEDLGLPHVDFTYGYGRVNARKARKVLENQWFKSGVISSNATNNITLQAPANAKGLKAMLVWADPAAAVGSVKALVNDLDMKVVNGSGQSFLPWGLNTEPNGVRLSAVRKLDTLNNMEQITLDVVGGETVNLTVTAKMLTGSSQSYWVIYDWETPELVLTYPLNDQKLKAGTVLPIRWDIDQLDISQLSLEVSSDSGQNWNPALSISKPDSLYAEWNLPSLDFQKRWFRLKGMSGSENVVSNWVKIQASFAPNVFVQSCNQTLKINWNSISSATRYEVLILDREAGAWRSKGFTNDNTFFLNQLDNGKSAAVSVKPWKGNTAGIQSDAVIGLPGPGLCPWAVDLGISHLESPKTGRRFTGSDPGTSAAIQLKIRNFGNQPLNDQVCRIYFKSMSGVVFHSDAVISLQADEEQTLTMPWTLDLAQEGEYVLRFWLTTQGDLNVGNDSLTTKIEVQPNPAIALPWQYNAENLGLVGIPYQITSTHSGLINEFGLDFNSSGEARFKTDIQNSPNYFGSKSLVMDKRRIDGNVGNGDLIFTLNLENYPNAGRLYLDFDWLPMGTMTAGNGLWVRANDQQSWIEVLQFWSESFVVGQVKSFRTIDLAPFLNGQTFSSSFQLKFTHSGFKPSTLANGGGYAIDNLILSFPKNDVSMLKLISPGDGCQDNVSHKVKIRVKNKSNQASHNVEVGYALPGQTTVLETISVIPAMDSMDYEFSTPVNAQALGKLDFKIWVNAADDGYPGNDTLRNQVVFIAPNVSVYPYYQGFESSDGFWKASGENNSWEWGTPSKKLTVLDTAANGTQMWGTGLSGAYPVNQYSFLESPCFNLSDIQTDVQFSFNSLFKTEQDYDFAWLEMSEDGRNWVKVGAKGQGTNWYNHDSDHWNGLRSYWEVSSLRISLASLTDKTKVRFRFGFSTDASVVSEGFGVDDVHLEPAFEIVSDITYEETLMNSTTGSWTEFGPRPDQVASVGNTEYLGLISLKMKRNAGIVRYHLGYPYLDRNFLIKPTLKPHGPVKVRLYINDDEVKKLAEADSRMNSFQELGIFKYDGPDQDLSIENNSDATGTGVFIPAGEVQKVPTAGGYYLEFSVNGFSEFYVTTHSLSGPDDPLAVSLISFTATPSHVKKQIDLEWITASEVNSDRFEVSYSCDGQNFEALQIRKSEGSPNQGYRYQFSHRPKSCASSLIYKLIQYDKGSHKPQEYRAMCQNPAFGLGSARVVNPVSDRLHVFDLQPKSSLLLVDVLGKIWLQTESQSPEFEYSCSQLPKGNYWLKIDSETDRQTIPIVKVW